MTAMKGRGGAWTQRKLSAVAGYLKAFNTALKNRNYTRFYIDAFAGSGDRVLPELPLLDDNPEISALAMGSVRVALETDPPFHRHLFIEKMPKHVADLESVAKEFPQRRIEIHKADANSKLVEICNNWDQRNWRGVLFIDPYGCQVEWRTLQAVSQTQALDVWLLFPVNAVRRMLANDPNRIQDGWRERLTMLFGTDEWFNYFYEAAPKPDLLGDAVVERNVTLDRIEDFYRERLLTVFGGGVCEAPLRLGPSAREPLFSLFFACSNTRSTARRVAFDIANHILKVG